MNGTHSGTGPDHSTSRSGTDIAIGPLTVAEAAALLGVEPRTVIKYRQQGKIRGEKQGKAWHLWLAQTFIDTTRAERSGMRSGTDPEQQTARSGTHSESIEAAYRVTPVEIEQAIERTGQKYVTDMTALYDRISAEVGKLYEGQLVAKYETIATQREALATQAETVAEQRATIAELRRRADGVEVAAPASQQEGETTPEDIADAYLETLVDAALARQAERDAQVGIRRSGSKTAAHRRDVKARLAVRLAKLSSPPPPPTRWGRLRAWLWGE